MPDASRTINTIRRLEEHERSLEKRKELLEERVKEQLLKARDASRAGSKALALQVRLGSTTLGGETGVPASQGRSGASPLDVKATA